MIGRLGALGLAGAALAGTILSGAALAQQAGPAEPETNLPAPGEGPQVTPETAQPLPTIQWSRSQARELVKALKASSADGLDPKDYGIEGVEVALEGGEGPELNQAATRAAMTVSVEMSDRSCAIMFLSTLWRSVPCSIDFASAGS